MNTLEATFRIVTPLFMGGAALDNAAELRAPAIKGMLRFWWRAKNYATCQGDINELAKRESKLFGSTEKSCPFQMQVCVKGELVEQTSGVFQELINPDRPGVRYLGYGLMEAANRKNKMTKQTIPAGQLQRGYIKHGQSFSIKLVSKNDFENDLIDTIKLFGLLGGMGSRSRKGFGSVTLEEITKNNNPIWEKPKNIHDYPYKLTSFFEKTDSFRSEPEISAFSIWSKLVFVKEGTNPLALLDEWGQKMQLYRSWVKSEKNFKKDHDWYRYQGNYRETDFHPRRVMFGLPHNYDSKRPEGIVNGSCHSRRASPLFFHIHEFSSQSYCAIALLLRSSFLAPDEKINAGGKEVPFVPSWDIFDKFLNTTDYFPKLKPWLQEATI